MIRPNTGSTPNEIVEYYFRGLPSKPKKHARDYILRLHVFHRWRIGSSLDEVPFYLGQESIAELESRERIETLAVRALYEAYFAAREQENPDWTEFEALADSLPRYDKNRGFDASPWTVRLPVLPLYLYGKNAKQFPRDLEC